MTDPRYPKYVAELLRLGISEPTAKRAAEVRIESEDKRARLMKNLDEYQGRKFRSPSQRKNHANT